MTDSARPLSSKESVSKLLANIIADQKGDFWLAAILLLFTGASEGASIALLIPLIGLVNTDENTISLPLPSDILGVSAISLSLGVFLAAFLGVIALRALLVHASTLANARLVQDYVKSTRIRLFDGIVHAKWTYLSGLRNADLYHTLTADIDRIQSTVTLLMELIKSVFLILIYLSLSLLISWRLTLAATAIGLFLITVLHPLRRRASKHGDTYTTARREQSRIVSDFLDNMKVSKAYAAEDRFSQMLAMSMTDLRETIISFLCLSSRVNLIIQIGSSVALCAIVYLALTAFKLTAPATLAILVLYFRFAPKVLQLQAHIQALNSNMSALQNVISHIREAEDQQEIPEAKPSRLRELNRDIVLKDVSFVYPEGKQAIRKLNLRIPANRISVLAGPTGSGKSTLADLLMGIMTPTEGKIEVAGAPLDVIGIKAWRQSIAYVPQDPFLLHATIRENLLFAAPNASEADIREALRASHTEGLVSSLPTGLDTIVGARGQLLSGGERQRLVLARALLRRPTLLILDEATSALDWEHEEMIASSLEALKQQLTIVMIAHRRRMITLADHVIILQEGAVTEHGPPNELRADAEGYLSKLETSGA